MKDFNIFTDRGSRVFSIIAIILGLAIIVRCTVEMIQSRHDYDASQFVIYPASEFDSVPWEDDIRNPNNYEFVVEISFNHEKMPSEVTQQEFNERYLK